MVQPDSLNVGLKQQFLCDPLELSPMATAVRLRAKLLDLGYRVLLMSPHDMQIAQPDRPNRFQGFHIDQAERLLERLYE